MEENYNENLIENDRIIPVKIEEEMKNSYIDYSMSVIVSRALPDVRDGFKPVHRRVLFGMNELGNTSDKPTKKSARIVGEVMGKYHPHGDSSIYDAMVRLAQPFNTHYPLVDGHGNFGSVDGDGAAAMRYTEARMTPFALQMLRDIDKETVDFMPNFDEEEMEPTVLPSRIPNLLVNGSNGIAVGMATSIPPHNLSEVIDACVKMIDDRDATIDDLIKIVKGPDFPTGAMIMGKGNIKSAYKTGQGKVIVRSKTMIEEANRGKMQIVVTEIPYGVYTNTICGQLEEIVNGEDNPGIERFNDLTGSTPLIKIYLAKKANPDRVLKYLYKNTFLQYHYGINFTMLDNGRFPRVFGWKEMLQSHIDHERLVYKRAFEFDLNKIKSRIHIIDGLLICMARIEEVIQTIRNSASSAAASVALQQNFLLDEAQAKAVLDMIIILIMTCAMGKGCIFSAIPVAILQGFVTVLARFLQPIMTEAALDGDFDTACAVVVNTNAFSNGDVDTTPHVCNQWFVLNV